MKKYDKRLIENFDNYYNHTTTKLLLSDMLQLFNDNRNKMSYRFSLIHELGHVDALFDMEGIVKAMKVKDYIILFHQHDYQVFYAKDYCKVDKRFKKNQSKVSCFFDDWDLQNRLYESLLGGILASNELRHTRHSNPIVRYDFFCSRLSNQTYRRKAGSDGYHLRKIKKYGYKYASLINENFKKAAQDSCLYYSIITRDMQAAKVHCEHDV